MADVEFIPEQLAQQTFGGRLCMVTGKFRNAGTAPLNQEVQWRLYQAGTGILAPMDEAKSLKVLHFAPGQTVLENLTVEFPEVQAKTTFYLAWFAGQKKLGSTPICVYPTNLLKPLGVLAGDSPIGLLDPENQLKPAFASLRYQELKDAEELASCECALIIIAPVAPQHRSPGLRSAVKQKAQNGAGIVWIQPAVARLEPVPPAFILPEGSGRIVRVGAETMIDLRQSPPAQLNLVLMSEFATRRRHLDLPTDPQP